jgi:uncharacterized flavoprotein (TIGR03862 family)
LYEQKRSIGRKFLVAGRGGLNLTHEEPLVEFASRYHGGAPARGWWQSVLAEFGPDDLRQWADGLGCETFVASSGRVYPRDLKAAALLRSWRDRLREKGVVFHVNHRLVGMRGQPVLSLEFACEGGTERCEPAAAVLALGGGSWPETGSDGAWVPLLQGLGISMSPLLPANCGWEVEWSPRLLAAAEGVPLKNLAVWAHGHRVEGELLITKYGLEGGAIYQLGHVLRVQPQPALQIDFKPGNNTEQLRRKMSGAKGDLWAAASGRWKLSPAAAALVEYAHPSVGESTPEILAGLVKHCTIPLLRPRPLEEAISSAGGVSWSELDEHLMLRRAPGIFVAGEMIDWEAPTGGYLLQGAFSTGTCAGRSAALWAADSLEMPTRLSGAG